MKSRGPFLDARVPPSGDGAASDDAYAKPDTSLFDGGVCSAAQRAERWGKMLREPIAPPRYGAGLDMAGGMTMPGLTLLQAEEINCDCVPRGDIFWKADAGGDAGLSPIESCAWGQNQEVIFSYFPGSQDGWMLEFLPGYTGALGCNGNEPGDSPSGPCQQLVSRDGKHTSQVPLDSQVQKDGADFEIDWLDPVNGPAELNEIADALMATFAPELPAEPDCIGDGHCVIETEADVPYFGITELGLFLMAASQSAPQPIPSIITSIQLYQSCVPTADAGTVCEWGP